MKYPDFEQDKRTRYAVERQLLVIGEAANHLPENYLSKHQQIPWRQIIGMRNIIAHEYGEIMSKRIWSVVKNEVPKLVHQLNDLLEE